MSRCDVEEDDGKVLRLRVWRKRVVAVVVEVDSL